MTSTDRGLHWGFSPSVIAVAYVLVGLTMLFFSDYLLPLLTEDPLLARLQGFKGALEVGLTALVFYLILRVAFDELFVKNEMIDQATVGVTLAKPDAPVTPITFANEKIQSMTGFSESELLENGHERLWNNPDSESVQAFREACREGDGTRVELECVRSDGSTFVNSVEISPIDRNGHSSELVVFHRDITAMKDYEQQLERSLRDNRTLLQEVHHRVKNNMQVLLSLIGLQMREVEDETAARCLRQSKQRIRSMGLIHEKLYESEEMSDLDFDNYVEELVDEIVHSQQVPQQDVRIKTRVESVDLDVDFIVSCGLVINELVTNSIQHGRSSDGEVEVEVNFERVNSHFLLAVTDNGDATPADVEEAQLGLRLVRRLVVEQLDGSLDFRAGDGLTVAAALPVEKGLKKRTGD